MQIIGISGRKTSGKTTLTQRLVEHYELEGREVSVFSPADPLKAYAVKTFGLDPKLVYGSQDDKLSLTPYYRDGKQLTIRDCLQQMREWLDWSRERVMEELSESIFTEPRDIVIVESIRFPEEVMYVKGKSVDDRDGKIIKVSDVHGPVIRLSKGFALTDPHESETALDPWNYPWTNFDLILHNAELTPDQTFNKVLNFLESYYARITPKT